MLIRVQAPYFTAGLVLQDNVCIQAAPILAWCKGKHADDLRAYFKTAKWKATIVKELPSESVVTLTENLRTAPKSDIEALERLFGKAMINSIVGGNAKQFEGEWTVSAPAAASQEE